MINNEYCLIFGGAGSIGSELVRQLALNNKVYVFDLDETRMYDLVEELGIEGRVGNVEDYDQVKEAFEEFKPTLVFMAAARKHVTPSEQKPIEAIRTNILGTYNVIKACKKYPPARLINISTDKVVNARGIMGATKGVAEIMVRNAGYISVRFGNVMASRGSVLEIWQRQIDKGEALTVTDENMTRYFMSIPEACELLIKAAEVGEPGQILIMNMGDKVNILQLAKDIIGKAGKGLAIEMIGLRPGEALTESLMTVEEEKRAVRKDNFLII